MNPIKNALKSTSITMVNVIVAFVFRYNCKNLDP